MSDGSQDRLYTRDEMMQARRRIADLEAALDCIPAKRMLSFGSPYTLTFGEEALRKIDTALDAARREGGAG